MINEYAFYSANSGLTPPQFFSLADHRQAYFAVQDNAPYDSWNDQEYAFLLTHVTGATAFMDKDYLNLLYFQQQTSLTGDIDFLRASYYTNPPSLHTITIKGQIGAYSSVGSSAMTVPQDGAAVGDWIVMAFMSGANSITYTPTETGWTTEYYNGSIGTRSVGIYSRLRAGGDPTTYGWTMSAGPFTTAAAIWGGSSAGTVVANWITGTPYTGGGTRTNVSTIPGIITAVAHTLVLMVSLEATTATETAGPVLTGMSGGSNLFYEPQSGSNVETIQFATLDAVSAQTVAAAVETYQNVQASNAAGIMLGIVPV